MTACHRKLLPGEENWDPLRKNTRWKNDIFSDLYNNDTLYAYTIRASEEFCLLDWEKLRDPVLHCLLGVGLLDWVDKDDRLNQATQASWISTTMSMRILERLIQEEDKVMCVIHAAVLMLTDTLIVA